jgi:hypothetical protein
MVPEDDTEYGLTKGRPNRKLRRFKYGSKIDSEDRKFTNKGARHRIDDYTKSANEAKRLRRNARKAARLAARGDDE